MAKGNDDVKRIPAIVGTVKDGALVLTFADGRELTLAPSALTEEVRATATLHGLKQKLVDAAAISRSPETGRTATVGDKYDAVRAVFDRLLAGHWNAPREGGGSGAGGLLFRALCRLYAGRKTEAELREYLAGKTDAERAALRKNARIAPIIEEIKAESAKDEGIDGDALLGELEQ